MKYRILVAALGIFLCGTDLRGMNVLRDCCVDFGKFIENNDVPVIGKLTNLLPAALVATSFKDYPGQTMILLTGLLAYILSRNESVREILGKYKRICFSRLGIKGNNAIEVDETLFIFDGEDADDAEHEMEIEDDLLDEDSLSSDDERNDSSKQKELVQQQQPIIKFL